MSSSEIRKLRESVVDEKTQSEFVTAISRFLTAHPLDGGADDDLVRTTGWRLEKAGFWKVVSPEALASVMSDIPEASCRAFFENDLEFFAQIPKPVRFVEPHDIDQEITELMGRIQLAPLRSVGHNARYQGVEFHLEDSVSIPVIRKIGLGTWEMKHDSRTGTILVTGVGPKSYGSTVFGKLGKSSASPERLAGKKRKSQTPTKAR